MNGSDRVNETVARNGVAVLLLLAALVLPSPAAAQPPSPSSGGNAQSAAGDGGSDGAYDLPVSLDRIREQLARIPDRPLLQGLEFEADFRVIVEERRFVVDLLNNFDVGNSPPPPGGLYGYEQQRLLRNPVQHPLEQPYAAFSTGELLQVAATSTLTSVLTRYLTEGLTRSTRARQERAAREEVRRAIGAYCAAQTQGPAVALCIATLTRAE